MERQEDEQVHFNPMKQLAVNQSPDTFWPGWLTFYSEV